MPSCQYYLTEVASGQQSLSQQNLGHSFAAALLYQQKMHELQYCLIIQVFVTLEYNYPTFLTEFALSDLDFNCVVM